jgi:hypothetical protein
MLQLPSQLMTLYRAHLDTRGIKSEFFDDYLKWLRYFLDFSEKYKVSGQESQRLRLFVNKLKEKNQTEDQRRRKHPWDLELEFQIFILSVSAEIDKPDPRGVPGAFIMKSSKLEYPVL